MMKDFSFAKHLLVVGFLVGLVITLMGVAIGHSSPKSKYVIRTDYQIYYIENFRCYGTGIVFDDHTGKRVLVQGSYSIERQKMEGE